MQPTNLPTNQPTNQQTNQLIYNFTHATTNPPINQPTNAVIHSFNHPFIHPLSHLVITKHHLFLSVLIITWLCIMPSLTLVWWRWWCVVLACWWVCLLTDHCSSILHIIMQHGYLSVLVITCHYLSSLFTTSWLVELVGLWEGVFILKRCKLIRMSYNEKERWN